MSGWTAHVVTSPPVATPVVEADARTHCVADSGDPAPFAIYVAAAQDMVERVTGTRLISQTVTAQRADLCQRMTIPFGPVQSVGLTYLDPTGAQQTVDTSLYALIGAGTLAARIELLPGKSWPSLLAHPAAVTLTAQIGYGNSAAAVPAALRHAILLLVGDFYANREDTIAERGVVPATLPNGVDALLANYRVW